MRNLLQFSLLFACLLFAGSTLADWHLGFSWHDQQRLYQLILLCVAAGLTYFLPAANLPRYAFILLLTLLGFGLLSSCFASFPAWALKEWARYAGLLILALIIADSARKPWFFKAILYLLAGAALLKAFQALIYYLLALALDHALMFNTALMFYGFSNPRFLNQFQMLCMPILAYLTILHWQAKHRYSKLLSGLFFITLLLQWCIAFSLGGRGLWLGLAASHIALIVFFPRFWRLLRVQTAGGLLGFILFYLMFTMIPEWLGKTPVVIDNLRFGLSNREVIWQIAWDKFLAHPWLGIGPMHFSAEVNPVAAHPHQVILQWLAEWGIFATLVAIFIAVWGMLHGLRYVRSEAGEQVDAALWMSILGALALAQVDGVFVMPYTETWLAILIGLAIARWSHTQAAHKTQENRWQTYSLRLLAVPVILVVGNVLINEVPTLVQNNQARTEKHRIRYTPRFWIQGWISMDGQPLPHAPSSRLQQQSPRSFP